MRIRETIVAAGFISTLAAAMLVPKEAAAQVPPVPPTVQRDPGWGAVSNVTMVMGAATVFLMPRVFYNDPEATVGWKGRWHFSVLAPAMSLTAMTLLVDGPIKSAIQSNRPGCTLDETQFAFPGSGCESFGGPSTQSYASWGATGAGVSIFLVDTIKYSDWRFNVPSFVGNVGVPLTLSVITSIGRGVNPGTTTAYENGGQIVAGALTGLLSGALVGLSYSLLERPNCGYGNAIFCW
jgi:hypothetical protein